MSRPTRAAKRRRAQRQREARTDTVRAQLPRWARASDLDLPMSVCIDGQWYVSPDRYGSELVAWCRRIDELRRGRPRITVHMYDDPALHQAVTRITMAREHGVTAPGGVA